MRISKKLAGSLLDGEDSVGSLSSLSGWSRISSAFPLTKAKRLLRLSTMIKHTLLLGAVLVAAQSPLSAQDGAKPATAAAPAPAAPAPAAATPAPAAAAGADPLAGVPMDKVSYFIGQNFGKRLAGQEFSLNYDALLAGIKDAADAKPSKYPEAEEQAVMGQFQTAMQALEGKRAEKNVQKGKDFLATNGKKPGVTTTATGLQYEIMKAAEGAKPKATDKVKVHYHGTLLNGTVFDSSVQRGEPIEFALNQVIPGWTEGVQLMNKGSKYKFTIPSELAYGANGQGSIGPNEVLVFEVELIDFKAE